MDTTGARPPTGTALRRQVADLIPPQGYRDAADAAEDAGRIAAQLAVPGLRQAYGAEIRRWARHVSHRGRESGPRGTTPPDQARRVRTTLVAGVAVVVLGIALVALDPRGGGPALDLESAAVPASLVSWFGVGLLASVERRRVADADLREYAPARLHAALGVILLTFATLSAIFRRDDIDGVAPALGLALFGLAGLAELVQWRRARACEPVRDRRDPLTAFQTGLAPWWAAQGERVDQSPGSPLRRTYAEVLTVLVERGHLTADDARAATDAPLVWRERRS